MKTKNKVGVKKWVIGMPLSLIGFLIMMYGVKHQDDHPILFFVGMFVFIVGYGEFSKTENKAL